MRGGALSDFLLQRRKKPDFVAFDFPTESVPSGRTSIGRLCLRTPTSPLPTTFEQFAEHISNDSYAEFAFYLDTCFIITQEIPPAVWDALFRHRIVITEDVWHELESWRNNPTVNVCIHSRLLNAVRAGDSNVEFQSERTFPADCKKIADYYTVLLGLRKRVFSIAETYLQQKLKRMPTAAEVHKQVQKIVQDRGMALATKGKLAFDSKSENLLTDERIVASAFVRAVAMGQESSILTYDDDLREQFFKLQYLLDTHYRSMLVAEAFVEQPLNFYFVTDEVTKNLAVAYDSVELWSRPVGLEMRLLPESHRFVNVNLYRFGGSPGNLLVFPMCFSAEREMERLFSAKLATGGANTDKLGGKNLHICPFPETEVGGGLVAISKDANFLKLDSFAVSVIDAEMALRRFEQSASVMDVSLEQQSDIHSSEIDASLRFLSASTLNRLQLSLAVKPSCIGNGMLSFVLKMYPQPAEVIVDRSITPDFLPEEVRDAIDIRDGWWVSKSPLQWKSKEAGKYAVDYYTSILAHKKLFTKVIEPRLASQLGKIPSIDDLLTEIASYDRGSCTYRASEFLNASSDPAIFEDDRVIASSMLRAIGSGADTVFLTRSKSTFEQFCTLSRLLHVHYRAWCITQRFGDEDDPLGHMKKVVTQQNLFEQAQSAEQAVEAFDDVILPKAGLRVRSHCWLLERSGADSLSIFTAEVALERPMIHMLIANESFLESSENGEHDSLRPAWCKVRDGLAKVLTPDNFDLHPRVNIGSADFPNDERLKVQVSSVDRADLVFVHREGGLFDFPWRRKEHDSLD